MTSSSATRVQSLGRRPRFRNLCRTAGYGLLAALALAACAKEKPALPPTPATVIVCPQPTPLDAGAPLRTTTVATPATPDPAAVDPQLARLFPGADSGRTARTRKATAVLLFTPPGPKGMLSESGLLSVDRLRFVPIVCAIGGKLAVGARCGEAMPQRAKVRLTEAGSAVGIEELELERSTLPFVDTQRSQRYAAPYGPACCMYNTCVGKTVPYYPRESPADSIGHSVLTTTQTLLAVWPADAEIDLAAFAPGVSAEAKVDDGPWTKEISAESPLRLVQTAQLGTRRYASIGQGWLSRGLFQNVGSGWQQVLNAMGVREYYLLSSSDLDGDGRPELLVYERWANDYGLDLLANDAPSALYRFTCGNI